MARLRVSHSCAGVSTDVGIVEGAGIILKDPDAAAGLNRFGFRSTRVETLLRLIGLNCGPEVVGCLKIIPSARRHKDSRYLRIVDVREMTYRYGCTGPPSGPSTDWANLVTEKFLKGLPRPRTRKTVSWVPAVLRLQLASLRESSRGFAVG